MLADPVLEELVLRGLIPQTLLQPARRPRPASRPPDLADGLTSLLFAASVLHATLVLLTSPVSGAFRDRSGLCSRAWLPRMLHSVSWNPTALLSQLAWS